MNSSDFDMSQLATYPEGSISDLLLDQYHLGELDEAEKMRVKALVDESEELRGRLSLRTQGLEAFPSLDSNQIVARIHQQTAHINLESPGAGLIDRMLASLRQQPAFASFAAAVGAVALVVIIQVFTPNTQSPPDGIIAKGSLGLTVFCERGGQVQEAISGDTFFAGDRLRFRVNTSQAGQVMVVGRESSGELYSAYPLDGTNASQPLESGVHTLAGAVQLDAAAGQESLFLIHCEQTFNLSKVHSEADSQEVQVPTGCSIVRFDMNKVSP